MASIGSFPNSGFDLFVPNKTDFTTPYKTVFIDSEVKSEMLYYDVSQKVLNTCGYMVFPRSSISKTPLMLANHTGIIDAGYRGNLIGAFRLLELPENQSTYCVEKNTRLLQIVHPSLCPVFVVIVDECELTPTDRGTGGFGSTGIVGLKI
jgi:dUTP pyrophosphatase